MLKTINNFEIITNCKAFFQDAFVKWFVADLSAIGLLLTSYAMNVYIRLHWVNISNNLAGKIDQKYVEKWNGEPAGFEEIENYFKKNCDQMEENIEQEIMISRDHFDHDELITKQHNFVLCNVFSKIGKWIVSNLYNKALHPIYFILFQFLLLVLW